jgi:8-oxo-dGTP diphosphatase
MFEYPYKMLSLTADAVILCEDNGLEVFTIERSAEPYKGYRAIVGGFVDVDTETAFQAFVRETKEETGFDVLDEMCKYAKIDTYDDPGRDPRQRTITTAFLLVVDKSQKHRFVAADDAINGRWDKVVDIVNEFVGPVGFDHIRIINDAVAKYQNPHFSLALSTE